MKNIIQLFSFILFLAPFLPAQGATLSHRYSFDADTTDSVGGNTGILEGGATISSGQLTLTGLGSSIDANRMTFTNPVDIGGNFGDSANILAKVSPLHSTKIPPTFW